MLFQDSVSVENALYADPRILEAAAVGVPDERLGELVAAVVYVKPAFQDRVTEAALIALARKRFGYLMNVIWLVSDIPYRLPRFAIPVMIVLLNHPFGELIGFVFNRQTVLMPAQSIPHLARSSKENSEKSLNSIGNQDVALALRENRWPTFRVV